MTESDTGTGMYHCSICGAGSYEKGRLFDIGGALYCAKCRPVLAIDRLSRLEERVTALEEKEPDLDDTQEYEMPDELRLSVTTTKYHVDREYRVDRYRRGGS